MPTDRIEPVHIISLGAGVQSSCMSLMAAAGEITPMPTAAVFADTQAEPDSVYKWLDWLEKQLPFPVHRVSKGDLTKSVLRLRHKATGEPWSESNIPYYTAYDDGSKGQNQRQCTTHYKVKPIVKEMRRIASVPRGCKTIRVIQWIGISSDEFIRMKPSREPWLESRWPLIEERMNRQMCLEWMRSRKFPEPPRSACTYCPFHSGKEWREMQLHDPKSFAEAVRVEKELQITKSKVDAMKSVPYLHRSCKPLDTIDFRDDFERGQLSLWQDECSGHCGV